MERIKLLSNGEASESANKVLDEITNKGQRLINIFKIMANSPAVIKSFFGMHKALEEKKISSEIAERIAIMLAVMNGCEYCLAAHSYSGGKLLSPDEVFSARQGKSSDAKAQSALYFAKIVMTKAGRVTDEELELAKSVGFSDTELLEIVAIVSLNFFTNAINSVAHTPIDFPKPKTD